MPTTKQETSAAYQHVHYKEYNGTLYVSDMGIRFQSDDNTTGLILVKDQLANVSTSSFPVQNLYLLNLTSFADDESYLNSFQMANGVDMVRAKDNIEALLKVRGGLPCNVSERLAERQEAAFYAF